MTTTDLLVKILAQHEAFFRKMAEEIELRQPGAGGSMLKLANAARTVLTLHKLSSGGELSPQAQAEFGRDLAAVMAEASQIKRDRN